MRSHHRQHGFGTFLIVVIVSVLALMWLVGATAILSTLAKRNQQAALNATPSKSTEAPAAGSTYVAMGDSYSAGWGADRTPDNLTIDRSLYDTSTKCLHNKKSAQYIVAKDLGYNLIDASCGGAVTGNILKDPQLDNPPQITKMTADTSLVTMTIGGNDTALLYVLSCIQTSDCSNNILVKTLVKARIAGLQTSINQIYKQIIAKSPHAKIRHAGYPYLIAPPGQPAGTCTWLTSGEQQLFDELLTDTNNKIKETIQQFAKDTGTDARYVDPLAADSPFMQKDNGQMLDGCSTSSKRYMNGPNDGTEGGWHPNIYGQEAYAKIYEDSL